MLALPKVTKHIPRKREGMSDTHLKMIRKLPCVVTGRRPVEAHHLLTGPGIVRGMAYKSADCWAVPITKEVHDEIHNRFGNDYTYFQQRGINAPALARELWDASGDYSEMCRIVELYMKAAMKFRWSR